MCGISGYYNAFRSQADTAAVVKVMSDRLFHRGPESEGFYSSNHLTLGHRRLKIIDLSTGDQPIYNEDRSVVIVFNGEIYNYQALRHLLEARGHQFSTASDTETIVHAYEEFGVQCLTYLEGMFSFALWDDRNQCLFLAVDRLGIKPLVYYHNGDQLIFASEIGALEACAAVPKQLCQSAVTHYFDFGYIPGPLTIYEDVHKLPPGHFMLVENGKVRREPYWNLIESIQPISDVVEAQERLRILMETAVRKRLIADVPLGAFLSGGIDSSIIVGLMTQLMNEPVKTFSIGFEDQPLLDESAYAQMVSDFNGTDHHAIHLNYHDVLAAIPDALNSLGEPFADYSFLPTYLVSRETRREVTVALSGDGADELFAGYNKYRGEIYQQYYYALPSAIREQILHPLIRTIPVGRRSRISEFSRQARRFIDGVSDDPVSRHLGLMRIVQPDIRKLLLENNGDTLQMQTAVTGFYEQAQKAWNGDRINRMLFADTQIGLPYDMLTKVDLASMQHALEVRVPFLDHHVVEFAFGLSGSLKAKGTRSKIILKETFSDLLPSALLKRRKQGFDLPIGEWFKYELKDVFHDVVYQNLETDPILNKNMIRQIYKDHCEGDADYTKILWAIFTFQWWQRNHRPSL